MTRRSTRRDRRNTSTSESEGALIIAKRGTNAQRAEGKEERRSRLLLDEIPALNARASKTIKELADQIRRCCSDKKWTTDQKREACHELVTLASLSTKEVLHLAVEFPEPFREIAEQHVILGGQLG
jgi:hypothetical protein